MQDANPCARFPAAGLGLRGSVSGLRRRFGSGYPVPGAKYPVPSLGPRRSVSGLRPWRNGGREMGASLALRPDRGPRTEGRKSNTVPGTQSGTLLPYCLTALLPHCLIALLPCDRIMPRLLSPLLSERTRAQPDADGQIGREDEAVSIHEAHDGPIVGPQGPTRQGPFETTQDV